MTRRTRWWPKRWRRQDHTGGRYAPRLWPVWLVAPSAVLAAIAVAVVIYLQLHAVAVPRPGPNGGPASRDPLELIKTTITVAGFVGAVLVGVYGYRKQRLVEGDARRADAEQLAQRYTTAADQLGHEKAAVRLAGVYAMARLADDWIEQRQVCIDVLCAYLRMPYEPDPASEKYREGEREVRYTIIRDHLRDPSASDTWCGRDLDFTNTIFDGGDFGGSNFTGGRASFVNTEFTDGRVSFEGTKFTGGRVSFEGAKFTGDEVSFDSARFTGGVISFARAKIIDGTVAFFGARFAGGTVTFASAKFTGGEVSFDHARFTGGKILFLNAKFAGGQIFFFYTKFFGSEVSFESAEYTNGEVSFDDAEFTTACRITWGPFEPPAAWTELQEREQ